MLSEKSFEVGNKQAPIRKIFEYGLQRAAEIGAENVFDFSIGNPTSPVPEKFTERMIALLSEGSSIETHGYTVTNGLLELREALATNENKKHVVSSTSDDFFITCGAAPAIIITLNSIINSNNDEVIVLAPFFPEYGVFIKSCDAKMVVNPSSPGDFQIDFTALEMNINANTKVVIVNSPNNPSGVIYTKETIRRLSMLLEKKQEEYGHAIYLLSDEPYRELVYDDVELPYIPGMYDNTIVCYSYSKSLSIPGERIGYIYTQKQVADYEDLKKAIMGAARLSGHVCAPRIIQKTVIDCIETVTDISVYKANRDLLYNELSSIGFKMAKPDGAFYLFLESPEADAFHFCEVAMSHDILMVPGDPFGCKGYARISYCVDTKVVERSLVAFQKLGEHYF